MTHYINYINRLKGKKKHRIISTQKKPFNKNLTTFQDGTLNKLQTINYTNINIINDIMKRAQQWGKNESFSSEVKRKARMHTALQFNKALKPLEQLDEKRKSKVPKLKKK